MTALRAFSKFLESFHHLLPHIFSMVIIIIFSAGSLLFLAGKKIFSNGYCFNISGGKNVFIFNFTDFLGGTFNQ